MLLQTGGSLGSRLSTPLVPEYVPLPLDVIGNTLQQLDQKQAIGLESFNKFQQLIRTLGSQQIPVPEVQAEFDRILGEADQQLAKYAESKDFINAPAAIVAAANDVQNKLAPHLANYGRYQQSVKEIQDLRSNGKIFTEADKYVAFDKPLQQYREALASGDTNARFSAGAIAPRMDVHKAIDDFVKGFDPDAKVEFSPDGRYIIKTKNVDVNEVRNETEKMLRNNPQFQAGLRNDILYRMDTQYNTDDRINNYVNKATEQLTIRGQEIAASDLTDEQKEEAFKNLKEARSTLIKNPRGFIAQQLEKDIIGSLVDPYAEREGGLKDITINDDSYRMEDYRQRHRMRLAEYKKSLSGAESDLSLITASMGNVKYDFDYKNAPRDLETFKGQLDAAREKLANASNQTDRDSYTTHVALLEAEIAKRESIIDKVVRDNGIDMNAVNRVTNSKPPIPSGLSVEDARKAENAIEELKNLGGTGEASITSRRFIMNQLTPEGRIYANQLVEWDKRLTSEEKRIQSKLTSALKDYGKNYGSVETTGVSIPSDVRSQILSAIQVSPVGFTYLDMETGKPILENKPKITKVDLISPEVINGKIMLAGTDKDGNSYRIVPNEDGMTMAIADAITKKYGNNPRMANIASLLYNPQLVSAISNIPPGGKSIVPLTGDMIGLSDTDNILKIGNKQYYIERPLSEIPGNRSFFRLVDEDGRVAQNDDGETLEFRDVSGAVAAVKDFIRQKAEIERRSNE